MRSCPLSPGRLQRLLLPEFQRPFLHASPSSVWIDAHGQTVRAAQLRVYAGECPRGGFQLQVKSWPVKNDYRWVYDCYVFIIFSPHLPLPSQGFMSSLDHVEHCFHHSFCQHDQIHISLSSYCVSAANPSLGPTHSSSSPFPI